MKTTPFQMWQFAPLLVAFCLPRPLIAQESNPHPTDATSPTAESVNYQVLRRRVETIEVEEPAPLAGMTPVRKQISVTVDEVADPHLILPEPPPAAVQPDPQALAAFRAKMALRPKRVFIQLSATVYDGENTLLRWFPNGQQDKEMVAWSNVDFNLLAGKGRFTHNGKDYDLFLGMSNENSNFRRRTAERLGKPYTPPAIPPLPPDEDPAFVVIQGNPADAAVMEPINVLHDIFRADPAKFKAEYEAREAARKEHEAWLRAHPPEPQDIHLRVWEIEDEPQTAK
jgi:hypothetical protein